MFLREKLISDDDLFSSYEVQQGETNAFGGYTTGLWTAGFWLACRLNQDIKASTALDLGTTIFLISA